MTSELISDVGTRAAAYAALGDKARLRIVDILALGDASSSELAMALGIPTNLMTHHLQTLARAGIVSRRRSEGDGRRAYVRLERDFLEQPGAPPLVSAPRVLFVCTGNSARSHLAAAMWRNVSEVPATSAGTHPADRIHPGAIDVARRHNLALPRVPPRHLDDVAADDDLIVTVCDRAHEEIGARSRLHWSVPSPTRLATPKAFDESFDEISSRVANLAGRLAPL